MAEEKKISKDMMISEIMQAAPDSVPIMMEFGLHCFGCHGNLFETLEAGCLAHGMSRDDIDDLVKAINKQRDSKQ